METIIDTWLCLYSKLLLIQTEQLLLWWSAVTDDVSDSFLFKKLFNLPVLLKVLI